jgi:hypothetical protein
MTYATLMVAARRRVSSRLTSVVRSSGRSPSWLFFDGLLRGRVVLAGLAAIGLLAAGTPASAAKSQSFIAASCVPAPESVPLMTTGSFGVSFRAGQSGSILLRCPVIDPDGSWLGYRAHYRDPDGMDTAYRVRVALRRAEVGTNLSAPHCATDSNTRDQTGITAMGCRFTLPFDTDRFWYWLEVRLEKAPGATGPLEFLGIH